MRIPTPTTPKNVAMSVGFSTLRRMMASGSESAITDIMKASTVPGLPHELAEFADKSSAVILSGLPGDVIPMPQPVEHVLRHLVVRLLPMGSRHLVHELLDPDDAHPEIGHIDPRDGLLRHTYPRPLMILYALCLLQMVSRLRSGSDSRTRVISGSSLSQCLRLPRTVAT